MKRRASGWAAMGVVCLGAAAPAWADDLPGWDLLGLYVGAGVGESTVRSDNGFDPDYPTSSHPNHTAWKVMGGIRPIPFLGAEAQYIDFGHANGTDYFYTSANGSSRGADSHPKAGVLSAVGYLPLPFVDVFAKLGAARLATNLDSYDGDVLNRRTAWQTKVAYGAGVQGHFLGVAIRGEYERISSRYGDPDAFMVSATWTF